MLGSMAETAGTGPVFETLDVKLTPEQIEARRVECRWTIDQAAGIARLVRQDTGEVVRERALQASERQVKLFSLDGGKSDAH